MLVKNSAAKLIIIMMTTSKALKSEDKMTPNLVPDKSLNLHVLNGRTVFMVTIIELLHFLIFT